LEQSYLAPRNEVEKELVQIWREVLGINSISVNDNFFELGGHSLLAVHLFSLIDQRLGANLPLATLFQNATIAHLAEVIDKQQEPQNWTSLIEIEKQGTAPPFFCIHGITGDILWFRDLAQSMAPDYPFYGIQARGLDGVQPSFDDIQAMAAYYLKEIRRTQPKGPYYLGGASFGGTVALEMAQQLLAKGENVALLAIFDHSPHNIEIPTSQWNQSLVLVKIIKNFPNWLGEALHLGPTRLWARFLRKTRLKGKELRRANNGFGEARDLIDYADELPDFRRKLISSHYQIIRNYIPQAYPGQVTLFRAKSRPLLNPYDPEIGWQQLAPGKVDVRDVPGSHEGMFRKPNVDYLAQQLRNCFAQTQPQANGTKNSQ
jgi:thioesterase domain-containing protein/acyl carrier protein